MIRSRDGKGLSKPAAGTAYVFDPENAEHWSFDSCPESELFPCFHYEFLRDCPNVVRRVLDWRESIGYKPKNWRTAASPHSIGQPGPYERFIPEWPDLPYLVIPPESRKLHWQIQQQGGEILGAQMRLQRAREELERLLTGEPERLTSARAVRRIYIGPKRRYQAWLKRLGAWRLVKREGVSHLDVIAYGLYRNQPDVSRAVNWVDHRLKRMDQAEITT
jgi:hypothetical protein